MEHKPFDPKEMIQILESGRQIRMNTLAGGIAIISLLRARSILGQRVGQRNPEGEGRADRFSLPETTMK